MKLAYEDALVHLKMSLKDYMTSQGTVVHTNNSFRCPNKSAHKHGDKSPSGYLHNNDNPKWSCFKCKAGGDIFDYAHFLHDVPLEGPGFKYETIPHVIEAITADIEVDYGDVEIPSFIQIAGKTKEIFKANPAPYECLTDGTFGPDRKYSPELAKLIIDTFKIARLPTPIYDHPVFKPTTFPNSSPILIPITKNGFYLGCVGRHTERDVKESNAPKYQNSEKTENTNYPSIINYDRAIVNARKTGRLNIFEGVFNSILAVVSGMPNSIGILGINSKLSDFEELVQHSGVREIVFYLDKDASGIDRAIELGKLCHKMGYLALFYKFKDASRDYDILFAEGGEEFVNQITQEIELLSLIEFQLYSKGDFLADKSITKVTKFEKIMEMVAEYGSPIGARNYTESIIQYYRSENDDSVNFDDIFPRVRQSLADKSSPLLARINQITEVHTDQIQQAKTVEEKMSLVHTYHEVIQKSSDTLTAGLKTTSKRELEKMLLDQDTAGARLYKTGYANIDATIDQEDGFVFMQESLAGIMGKPSHGKSLFIRGFLMHQALTNPEVLVLYFSTDDSAKRTLAWIIAGMANVPFDQVVKPYKDRDRMAQEHIQEAQDRLRNIMGENLLLYDKRNAGSTSEIIRTINDAVREYPGKRIITATDNLFNSNDISMLTAEGSKRFAIDAAIEQYKQISMHAVDLVFNTLEVKKNTIGRLSDSDVKETGSINFRNDYTLSLFNSYREWRGESRMTTLLRGVPTPIIEVTILKNKVGGSGSTFFFHLNGPCGILEPVTDDDMIQQYLTLMRTDTGRSQGPRNETGGRSTSGMF